MISEKNLKEAIEEAQKAKLSDHVAPACLLMTTEEVPQHSATGWDALAFLHVFDVFLIAVTV